MPNVKDQRRGEKCDFNRGRRHPQITWPRRWFQTRHLGANVTNTLDQNGINIKVC